MSRDRGKPPDQGANPSGEKVNCYACRHFYITHEAKFPHGCKAMGFKALELPSLAVCRSSGMPCQAFSRKKNRPSQTS